MNLININKVQNKKIDFYEINNFREFKNFYCTYKEEIKKNKQKLNYVWKKFFEKTGNKAIQRKFSFLKVLKKETDIIEKVLSKKLEEKRQLNIFDIGAGNGRIWKEIEKNLNLEKYNKKLKINLIEISSHLLNSAKQSLNKPRYKFYNEDFSKFFLENKSRVAGSNALILATYHTIGNLGYVIKDNKKIMIVSLWKLLLSIFDFMGKDSTMIISFIPSGEREKALLSHAGIVLAEWKDVFSTESLNKLLIAFRNKKAIKLKDINSIKMFTDSFAPYAIFHESLRYLSRTFTIDEVIKSIKENQFVIDFKNDNNIMVTLVIKK